uniref:Uncharacterized protein n=1 Tax=Triticum urartu TaxID=4572 RepID=A0A8R7RC34_TRIUA
MQCMSARGGSARRGKGCPNGVKSKHLLLILWVFGMLLLWFCRVTVAEFVSAPLVAWSLGTISTEPRCCATLQDQVAPCVLRVHSGPFQPMPLSRGMGPCLVSVPIH